MIADYPGNHLGVPNARVTTPPATPQVVYDEYGSVSSSVVCLSYNEGRLWGCCNTLRGQTERGLRMSSIPAFAPADLTARIARAQRLPVRGQCR